MKSEAIFDMHKFPNYNFEWKNSENQRVYLYHFINVSFKKKGKPILWCWKSEFGEIFTRRGYKGEDDFGMLVLLCFLRYGSGYPNLFIWIFKICKLICMYIIIQKKKKKRKTVLMMENSGIGIEVLYNSNTKLSPLGCFEIYFISSYLLYSPTFFCLFSVFSFVVEAQCASNLRPWNMSTRTIQAKQWESFPTY